MCKISVKKNDMIGTAGQVTGEIKKKGYLNSTRLGLYYLFLISWIQAVKYLTQLD